MARYLLLAPHQPRLESRRVHGMNMIDPQPPWAQSVSLFLADGKLTRYERIIRIYRGNRICER